MRDPDLNDVISAVASLRTNVLVSTLCLLLCTIFLFIVVLDARDEVRRLEEKLEDAQRYRGAQITNLKVFKDSSNRRLEKLEEKVDDE